MILVVLLLLELRGRLSLWSHLLSLLRHGRHLLLLLTMIWCLHLRWELLCLHAG